MNDTTDMTNWALPGEPDVPRDSLKAQVEVYGETILLRGYDKDTTWVKTVSADEIAHVFTEHIGFASGLLPENALWWSQGETGRVVGLWRPPRVWPVALQLEAFKSPTRHRIPMPGLVFVCSPGRAPWAYAATGRPSRPDDILYRIPAYNVFDDGKVCPGSHSFPDDISRIPESFFESFFSATGDSHRRSQKHPDALAELWAELDGKDEYPLDDLVEQFSVEQAMEVSTGRRRRD